MKGILVMKKLADCLWHLVSSTLFFDNSIVGLGGLSQTL